MIGHLLGALQLGAAAFSLGASVAGLSGLALIAAGLFGLALLPPVVAAFVPDLVKRALVLAGVALLVGSALYQTGRVKGVQLATRLAAEKAVAAEGERARLAEEVRDKIAAQATADLAAEREANAKLKDLNDALSKDPGRDDPCLDRDLSRRLRDL